MFVDDRNLFSSHSNIKDLFNNLNLELNKIAVWFKANKLSLSAICKPPHWNWNWNWN